MSVARRIKNDALWLAGTLALALVRPLPRTWLRVLGRAVGRFAHAAIPSARRIARANVARAFPGDDDAARRALVRRAYLNLGEHLGDTVALLDGRAALAPVRFADGARATLDAAVAEGRGVVFASAHLGPWERVAASLVAAGVPFTAVARRAYDPRFTRVYERLRGGRGVPIVWRSDPGAAAALLRTLRRGRVLGVPMDLASRVPSIDAPFLGSFAPTPVGPARLALRTGAAVVVGTVAPAPTGDDDRLALEVTRIRTSDLANAPPDEAERELTCRINTELSRRIVALPDHWVWMHPRWPGRIPPHTR